MVAAYAAAGVSCWPCPARPLAVRRPMTAARSIASAVRLVRRTRAQVLFTSQVSYVALLAAVKALTGVRTAVHLGLVYDYPSPVFWRGVQSIDVGIAPSAHTAAGWRERGWPDATLRIIPNGVDTTVFCPGERAVARRALGLSSDEPVVAYVGRLVKEKGIFTLLRAMSEHRKSGGHGALIFVGDAPADEREQLARLANDEGYAEARLRILPATSTPEIVYRAADVVVVPAEWDEPFGLVPLEAAASGALVLVSARGVLPQLVAPLGAAAVFPSANVMALKDCLARWLGESDSVRAEAARKLGEFVRANYSFDRCGDEYLDVFERLLAS